MRGVFIDGDGAGRSYRSSVKFIMNRYRNDRYRAAIRLKTGLAL